MNPDSQALPRGWCLADLGVIGRYLNGRGFKKAEWSDKGRPIIRIQNLTGSSDGFNYFEGDVRPEHEVEPGDLLVSWAATLGAYRWRGPSAVLNQHIFKVESFIDQEFHFYALHWALEALYRSAHGSGMVHITKSKFDRTPIPLPPPGEQHRIVEAIESYLTRLDDAVATLERVQRNLERYRASVLEASVEGRLVPTEAELARTEGRDFESASVLLERILTERRRRWEEAELAKMKAKRKVPKDDRWKAKYQEPGSITHADLPDLPEGWCWVTMSALIVTGPQNGLYVPKSQYGGGTPILRIEDYQADWSRSAADLQQIAISDDDAEKYGLCVGDIVVNRVNSPSHLGKCLAVRDRNLPAVFESNMMRLGLPEAVAPTYIQHYLSSVTGKMRLTENAKWAVNQASINQGDVGATVVPLPPEREQRRIVAEIERLLSAAEDAASTTTVSVERCGRLRQSILKWAFEGRLVDQDPTDEPASRLVERIQAERDSRGRPRRSHRRPTARSSKT